MRKGILALLLVSWIVPATSYAGSITFNFSGGSSSTSGWRGNERLFTVDGVTVKARAFSFHDSGSTGYSAYLGHYSNGLGVTNCDNRIFDYCRGERHVVDNSGSDYDYVRFIFDQAVVPESVKLRIYYGNEADISYLLGPFSSDPGAWFNQEAGGTANAVTVLFSNSLATTELRIAAQFGETNDDFKIKSLTVRTAESVTEPGILGLLSLGLFGVVVSRVRNQ